MDAELYYGSGPPAWQRRLEAHALCARFEVTWRGDVAASSVMGQVSPMIITLGP